MLKTTPGEDAGGERRDRGAGAKNNGKEDGRSENREAWLQSHQRKGSENQAERALVRGFFSSSMVGKIFVVVYYG